MLCRYQCNFNWYFCSASSINKTINAPNNIYIYIDFHYCNRFWWWILRPPGFFLGFLSSIFSLSPKSALQPPHRNFFLYLSHLLFHIFHIFSSHWPDTKDQSEPPLNTVGDNEPGWGPPERPVRVETPKTPQWPWDPNPERKSKSESNEIVSEIRDEWGRCAYRRGIYIYDIYNTIFNNA